MMWQTQKDKDAHKEAVRNLDRRQKIEYIYTYFKWPILLSIIAFLILTNALYRHFTKKEVVVYVALANVSVGEDMESSLSEGFLNDAGFNPKRFEVYPYYGLYLSEDATTENHEYAYASQLKVLAAINSRQMDVVLMNREAYDILSHNGYLLDLSESGIAASLTENDVILEDNSIDHTLDASIELVIEKESIENAVDVSTYPLIKNAGFADAVYAGIIANTPRQETALKYLSYLMREE